MIFTRRLGRGYSLIELLVVMAIVGILALVAVAYRMDRMGPAVKGTLQEINGALSDARTLARSSGQSISLTPSGTGTTARLTYLTDVAITTVKPRGEFDLAADQSAANYCLVDFDGTGNPTSGALDSLRTAIGGALGGVDVFPTTAWQINAFHCSPVLQFNTNGTANHAAFVAVVGQRNGLMMPDGPIGIILVSASGNVYRYYRASNTSSWTRL